MNRVYIQRQASAEADEAAAWYEAQSPGLGVEFVLELDTAMVRAASSPEVYAMQYREAWTCRGLVDTWFKLLGAAEYSFSQTPSG